MGLIKDIFKKKQPPADTCAAANRESDRFTYRLAHNGEYLTESIFYDLREKVPVIDSCIHKIVRLTGDFTLQALDERYQPQLDAFCNDVPVGISGNSVHTFADMYLDSLLTYGRAVGRVFTDHRTMTVKGLYVGDPTLYTFTCGKSPLDIKVKGAFSKKDIPVTAPHKLMYTTLNPSPQDPQGVSLLRGLPAVSSLLMSIYDCIGRNFERAGNVRYAVTYKPAPDGSDRIYAKERAMAIAKEWADGMTASRSGVVKDFVTVGDVDIRVIGADNKVLDTQIPVRQLLEQIVAKLSIPPFMLGLNWSTTEKMSSQQADILTSELEYYRRLLTPVVQRVGDTFLRLMGAPCGCKVNWANINLQDEVNLAQARLDNARAQVLENSLQKGEN
ncbi:serine/threonine protein phosphatase [Ruminococcus sp. FC2018]|uniref:serine/threonine protein phosphatase n=1 Tax=Ruminococcus sp. FC2018 TaxID=1410617 RepID=UPI000AC057C6|nr:serine/threonine protein phosphatase [Ruminococcus sp. FC2018]